MTNNLTKANAKVTTSSTTRHSALLNAAKREVSESYRFVSEPIAYDKIRTFDGKEIKIYSHVIGRDC